MEFYASLPVELEQLKTAVDNVQEIANPSSAEVLSFSSMTQHL